MSEKTNGISLLVSNNHITVNADIQFMVEERENIPSAHLSDVIYQLVLQELRKHNNASLLPGAYKAVVTMCVSAVPAPETVNSQADSLVKEMLENDIPKSED